jgi:hypothetical protein
MSLEQRIVALETRGGGMVVPVIVITHDASFGLGKEVCSIDGNPVPRLPGEPFDQYKARAITLLTATPNPDPKNPCRILHISR